MGKQVDLLRFSTAGSVDDGKSTLIGRLLYDSKAIFVDQYEAIERASEKRGHESVDLALLTDGLRAEREQGITIDVAYRYFATPKRKFIIADTPGHIQYTRNMVTGASTAELAIILVDARKGVLTQSKRHAFLTSLLQVPHMVVVINKMDLVGWDQDTYRRIMDDYREFAAKLSVKDLVFIPASALLGDNIVDPSANMPWYRGSTLLHHLETVNVGASRNLVDFRFPVQLVVRPHQDFRGFAGQVASGSIRPGEEVVVLPSGLSTRVREVVSGKGEVAEAAAGDSVILTLEDEIDVSRGDMIVRRKNLPLGSTRFESTLSWLSDAPMKPSGEYVLRHTTRAVRAFISELNYRIDVDTLHRVNSDALELNDIGRAQITTTERLFFDAYDTNRATGSFILVDPVTNNTVAAGMIRRSTRELEDILPPELESRPRSSDVVWEDSKITLEMREHRQKHKGAVLWFTGLSGSGKSTIARQLEKQLFDLGLRTAHLDGDNVRHGLSGDLGFGADERKENMRRVAETSKLFFQHGSITLVSLISPFQADRQFARSLVPGGRFLEIHVDCDLETCQRRDPKGLYKKAELGEIKDFTGIDSPYEPPDSPELVFDTVVESVEQIVRKILDHLRLQNIIEP